MGHLSLFFSLEVYGTLSMFDTIFGEKKTLPQVICVLLNNWKNTLLITEGEKRAGIDMNKLHANLLNRLLYCSTTMHNFHLR